MILKWLNDRRKKLREEGKTELENNIRQHIEQRYGIEAPLHKIPELISMAAYTRYIEGAKEIGREICS